MNEVKKVRKRVIMEVGDERADCLRKLVINPYDMVDCTETLTVATLAGMTDKEVVACTGKAARDKDNEIHLKCVLCVCAALYVRSKDAGIVLWL